MGDETNVERREWSKEQIATMYDALEKWIALSASVGQVLDVAHEIIEADREEGIEGYEERWAREPHGIEGMANRRKYEISENQKEVEGVEDIFSEFVDEIRPWIMSMIDAAIEANAKYDNGPLDYEDGFSDGWWAAIGREHKADRTPQTEDES